MSPLLLKASLLVASFGVNTHIPYTDGGYANLPHVAADLAYLGVWNVRDSISNGAAGSAPISSYIWLAQKGVHFTFLSSTGGAWTDASLQSFLGLVDQVNEAVPGSVAAVEGANEINNFPMSFDGVDGLTGAVNFQQALYQSVHADPNLPGVMVDYFTGYSAGGIGAGPDPSTVSGLADFDNQHPYPGGGQPPSAWVNPRTVLTNEPQTQGPAVYTETGYSSNGGTHGAVNATVQGVYLADLLLDAAAAGVTSTNIYDLMDAYAPGSRQGDDGYGLFDYKNAPKPAAKALHNLTTILADTGANAATFTPAPLGVTISGLPSTGNALVAAKSNGVYEIILWQEPPLWNMRTGKPQAAAAVSVSVSFGATFREVNFYSPMNAATSTRSLANRRAVSVGLGEGAVIIELVPN